MSATAASEAKVLSMRLEASWPFIDEVRRFVESFCAAACPGTGQDGQVALAAHELLQNAIANGTSPSVELQVAIDPARRSVLLEVSNDCSSDRAARLRERLSRLYTHADALQAYLATMDETRGGPGGLGLARIRYESGLDLVVDERPGGLTVRAFGPLLPARAA
jgi:hypothetical protein